MRGTAGPERTRTRRPETLRYRGGRTEPLQTESREHERMPWQEPDRAEDLIEKVPGVRGEREHEAAPRLAVLAEAVNGRVERLFENAGRPVVERMRHRRRRVTPFQGVTCKRKAAKEGRDQPHRMDRRAIVVNEVGKRQLGAAGAAAEEG